MSKLPPFMDWPLIESRKAWREWREMEAEKERNAMAEKHTLAGDVRKLSWDTIHKILAGMPEGRFQLRLSGWFIVAWFVLELVFLPQAIEWYVQKFSTHSASEICFPSVRLGAEGPTIVTIPRKNLP